VCAADVKVIVPGDVVADESLAGIARDFNTRTFRILRDGDHPPIVLSK